MIFQHEFRGVLTGFALVASLVLLAISVNIGIPGQELLQSLRFHIVAALIPLPLMMLFCSAKLRAATFLALLLVSAGQGSATIAAQMHRRDATASTKTSLTVLSFNVLHNNPKREQVAEYLIDNPPDVAVLMEAEGIQAHLDDLRIVFPSIVGCTDETCDTAILSKFPVLETRIYSLHPFMRPRLVVARLDLGQVETTVVAVHLSKPYFDTANASELQMLGAALLKQTGPLVLAGDFNSAAWSNSIARMVEDNRLAPPPTLLATWPVEAGDFGIPIDNMFSRDGAMIRSIATVPPMGSNHRGLLAVVDLMPGSPP